jgi:hypothetical protein
LAWAIGFCAFGTLEMSQLQSGVKAMASEKRRCLGVAVLKGRAVRETEHWQKSKAVSSHRTKKLSPLDSLLVTRYSPLATRHPLELWI